MFRIRILLLTVWFCCYSFAITESFAQETDVTTYRVMQVYDGDTVRLRALNNHLNNERASNIAANDFKLRLTDIDAPERTQSYGKKSGRALRKLCKGEDIIVTAYFNGTDKYGRTLGKLYCNDVDASLYLAQQGLAWHNYKYSNDPIIANAALDARAQRLGLWKNKNPTPPWRWRQKNPQQYSRKN